LLSDVLKVVGQRKEDTENQEGETDDRYGEDIPGSKLPEVVDRLSEKIVQLLSNQSDSFRMSLPL